MQIVEANNKNKFWLVTNWGRVGTKGQVGLGEFDTKSDVLNAFNKTFKKKAGVTWANRA